MSALLDRISPGICRQTFPCSRQNGHGKAQHRDRNEETIQLVYACLPPATVHALGQHLQAQTQIEQRAQQIWFAVVGQPASALNDWLRAEREVVNELCSALQLRNHPEPDVAPAFH